MYRPFLKWVKSAFQLGSLNAERSAKTNPKNTMESNMKPLFAPILPYWQQAGYFVDMDESNDNLLLLKHVNPSIDEYLLLGHENGHFVLYFWVAELPTPIDLAFVNALNCQLFSSMAVVYEETPNRLFIKQGVPDDFSAETLIGVCHAFGGDMEVAGCFFNEHYPNLAEVCQSADQSTKGAQA